MILIVDDDIAICASLKLLLKRAGYEAVTAGSMAGAIDIVRSQPLKLVIADMNFTSTTNGDDGLTLLRQIKIFAPDLPVILITAWASIPLAVKGIQGGAFDFIAKPWDNRMLLNTVATALTLNRPIPKTEAEEFDSCGIVAESNAMRKTIEMVRRVAPTEASVLITGENGTGKEMIARLIHANSPRRHKPMVAVNLGAVVPSLFESEIFGHAKGAFTGAIASHEGVVEAAAASTLFLDEIGELALQSQVKLLRVLQERNFQRVGESHVRRADFRLISATNADLPAAIAAGKFREDLFYRINLITLHLPPLRERRDDIAPLALHFARRVDPSAEISAEALEMLSQLPLPGNVRQLCNIIERAILISGCRRLEAAHFDLAATASATTESNAGQKPTLDESERKAIVDAMTVNKGNLTAAAAALGISRQALYRRLDKYNIRNLPW